MPRTRPIYNRKGAPLPDDSFIYLKGTGNCVGLFHELELYGYLAFVNRFTEANTQGVFSAVLWDAMPL